MMQETQLTQARWRWKANPITYNIGGNLKPKISVNQRQYPFDEQGGRLDRSESRIEFQTENL
ncbi:hypothetical protein LINGRAHAP2_LOCUS30641 [Linum grandiflorum]